jgi:16S rRNA (cytosine967-C5)-methyltransferase
MQDLPGFSTGEWWCRMRHGLASVALGNIKGSPLDLCAAPGGKTAQLAPPVLCNAVDDSVSRMSRLRENLARLNLPVTTLLADVLSLPTDTLYDNVLLDAPCSATGTIRRHPDLVYLKTPQQLGSLESLQQKMLEHAANLVKPGGKLIYCTCSLSPLEGERQVFFHRQGQGALGRFRGGPHS